MKNWLMYVNSLSSSTIPFRLVANVALCFSLLGALYSFLYVYANDLHGFFLPWKFISLSNYRFKFTCPYEVILFKLQLSTRLKEFKSPSSLKTKMKILIIQWILLFEVLLTDMQGCVAYFSNSKSNFTQEMNSSNFIELILFFKMRSFYFSNYQ